MSNAKKFFGGGVFFVSSALGGAKFRAKRKKIGKKKAPYVRCFEKDCLVVSKPPS